MSPRWGLSLGAIHFYTDIAPLGLYFLAIRVSTQMPPLRGWRPNDTKSYENPRNLCNPLNPRFRQA